MPFIKKSYCRARCGMTICQTWYSESAVQTVLKVSVENLCISSRSRTPEMGEEVEVGLMGARGLGVPESSESRESGTDGGRALVTIDPRGGAFK